MSRDTLRDPIRAELDDQLDEVRVRALWAGTERRVRARGGHWRRSAMGAALVMAAAVALTVYLVPPAPPRAFLALADGGVPVTVDAGAGATEVRFEDGSVIALERGARVSPRANGARALGLELERGSARFDIVPGGGREWTIDCGLARVRVLGTAFVIERDERALRVRVERGRVRVEGARVPGGARELGAGESIALEDAPPAIEPERSEVARAADEVAHPAQVDEVVEAEVAEPEVVGAEVVETSPVGSRREAARAAVRVEPWRALAERGDHAAAYAAIPEGTEARSAHASADELLSLADVARLSGHPEEAELPLTRFLDAHRADPRAPLAAITLARVLSRIPGRAADAVRALDRAVELGVPQAFDDEVRAQLAIQRGRAGDRAGAATAARAYLDAHPEGAWADEVARWAAE